MDDLHLEMASSGSFYQLPDEMLLKIFSYLDISDLVLNIQHVNDHWKAIVQDNSYWRDYVFTFDKQMADKEIILLLKNMPALQALVATRGATKEVIHTVCKTNKFITRLELHWNHKFTTFQLKTLVKNLPHIQHLTFPLLLRESEDEMEYSSLIQQLHELLSLRLLRFGFQIQDYFLKGIAAECLLLQEIDLGDHEFHEEDVVLFLEAKKKVISKFFIRGTNSIEIIRLLSTCKQLQALHFGYCGERLLNMPLLELPNLKHLGISQYSRENFSIIVRHLHKTTMSNLLKLDLSCCLDLPTFEHILDNCVQLKILILRNCFLRYAEDFQHIGKCIHLEYLDVKYSCIKDTVVEIFSAKCRKLRHLNISHTKITDLGFQYLMNLSELQTLKLDVTYISGQNFHLIPLHLLKLHELHVERCVNLDFQYIQQLQEQMTHLKIHTNRKITIPEVSVDLAETNILTELC